MSNIKPRVQKSHEILDHIDPNKPVRVYRNLHKGCLSVRQGTIVRCHADNVVLKNARFIVSENGRQKVIKEKKKNVHAFVEGYVVHARDTDWVDDYHWYEMTYNPYKTKGFTKRTTGEVCTTAKYVDVEQTVLAWNPISEEL